MNIADCKEVRRLKLTTGNSDILCFLHGDNLHIALVDEWEDGKTPMKREWHRRWSAAGKETKEPCPFDLRATAKPFPVSRNIMEGDSILSTYADLVPAARHLVSLIANG